MKNRIRINVLTSIAAEKEVLPTSKWVVYMQSRIFQMMLLVSLFYALIFDDYSIILAGISTNYIFDGVSIFIIVIFFTELVISLIYITGYFLSYYFWLDLISTLSMFSDLVLIKVAINDAG